MPTLDRHLIDAADAAQRLSHQISYAQTGGPNRPAHIVNARVLALAVIGHLAEVDAAAPKRRVV
jgi:hypothetical protein